MSDAVVEKLDELIREIRRSSHHERWLTYQGIADFLGYESGEHVRQKIVTLPDFPAPARPGGGHPRWLESEVHAWMQGQVRSN